MDEIQIVVALAVLYATYRWWSRPATPSGAAGTSASSGSGSGSSSSSSAANAQNERLNALASASIPSASLAQVQAMFPQLGEREIRWEFVRTGRVRTVEQVVQFLLDSPPSQPPTWFLAPRPVEQSSNSANTSGLPKAKHESLVQRLGIQDKAAAQDKEFSATPATRNAEDSDSVTVGADKGKATARQALEQWRAMSVKEKKVKMVLDARRRFLEKDAGLKTA